MGDEQLDALISELRTNGPDFQQPLPVVRASFEAMLGGLPVADDIDFKSDELGGIPCIRATTPVGAHDAALLYLHGGGYIIGSPQGYRSLAAELGRAAGVTTYAIDYRLAPENVFPAAVDDAVAAYDALLKRGISPKRIVIAGDSAGGGLTVATLVALRDKGMPLPAAGFLISPWTDLSCSGASIASKASEDPTLDRAGLMAMASQYLGTADARTPLASPLFANLAGLPPLLIHVGSAEILLDDSTRLAQAAGAAGVSVHLSIWPRMIHVWHAFAFMLKSGQDAVAEAGAFIKARLG